MPKTRALPALLLAVASFPAAWHGAAVAATGPLAAQGSDSFIEVANAIAFSHTGDAATARRDLASATLHDPQIAETFAGFGKSP